ncbi:MAG: T9SS type A sorting domain-containing protein [Saprospiraceae bacterium]
MHNIKTLVVITVFFTLSCLKIHAQQALLTTGKDAGGVGGSVSYSIGQVDYANFSSDSGRISLGVQQPLVIIMVGTDEPESTFSINAFPNPVKVAINLKLDVESMTLPKNKFSYALYDINGKLLATQGINDVLTVVSMEEFTSGIYLLRVKQNDAEFRTFKLFKTN